MDGRLSNRHILVAEDNWHLAYVLVDLIRLHQGSVVGPVSSEKEAWEALRGRTVDAAVLDVVLANGPCYALVAELLARNVPVVLTTGFSVAQLPDEFSGLPILPKPLHLETLVTHLAEHCQAA
jgi:CheY-like chemotaxis protein